MPRLNGCRNFSGLSGRHRATRDAGVRPEKRGEGGGLARLYFYDTSWATTPRALCSFVIAVSPPLVTLLEILQVLVTKSS